MLDVDQELQSGRISVAGFKAMRDAEIYGTATPMQWLEKRLLMIDTVLSSGRSVTFDTGSAQGQLCNAEEFYSWCEQHLPVAFECFIRNKKDR